MNGLVSIPISALNQFSYCPRRCFLIHVEGVFEENIFTIEGSLLHERSESGVRTVRNGMVEHRNVHLISGRYGLHGIADLIEETDGLFRPVEYKRGRRGKWVNDEAQLCAVALCLEDMLNLPPIAEGAIFYAQSGRRQVVEFTADLRRQTSELIAAVRTLVQTGIDPGSVVSPRCDGCSLYEVCLPVETPKLKAVRLETLFED